VPLPALPLLDDFNRPDESPLSDGGNWGQWPGFDQLDLVSHLARLSSAHVNYSQWQAATFSADQVAAGTMAAFNTAGGDGGEWSLLCCSDTIGSAAYALEFQVHSPSPTPVRFDLRRFGAHAWFSSGPIAAIPSPWQAGDAIALNIVGSTIEGYYARLGAWQLIFSADDFVLSGGQPPLGSGKVAIGGNLGVFLTPNPSYSAAYGGVGGQLYRLPLLGAG
jgi:hypothetical protein